MTIQEAIKHAEDVAKEQRAKAAWLDSIYEANGVDKAHVNICKNCADDHDKIAYWLAQLCQVQKIVNEYYNNRDKWCVEYRDKLFRQITSLIDRFESEAST